jgi:signal transduction histidine kinase
VAFAVILGTSLLSMFALMFWRSSHLLFDTIDRSVTEQVELLAARPPDMLVFMISSRMNHRPAVVTQVGLFAQDGTAIVGDIPVIPEGIDLTGRVRPVPAPGDPTIHWRAAGRRLADGRVLVAARAADEILEVRSDLIHGAATGIVPAILLSLLGGGLVGIATERRLRRINAAAERVIAGELGERLPGAPGGDELDRLCAIVNRMLERFEDVAATLKGVGDNIAHDLRTPLTSVRARLERSRRLVGPDTAAGVLITESITGIDRALSLVSALLRVAEIRNVRRDKAFTQFDLGTVLSETAETFRPLADEKGLEFRCPPPGTVTIFGDRDVLVEAVVNLVDNAVKFTTPPGAVGLFLEGTEAQPVVRVSDTGPGIAPADRGAVFRKFFRTDASRTKPGSGLGLGLVAEILALHRFGVTIGDERPGCRIELLCWPGAAGPDSVDQRETRSEEAHGSPYRK